MRSSNSAVNMSETMDFPSPGSKTIFVLTGWKNPNLPAIEHLRDYGHNVEQIVGWREANAPLPKRHADLVILDLDLSYAKSYAAIANVRRFFSGPLLVLAAQPDETMHILALELGADDFIGGDVSQSMFIARIKVLLRRGEGEHTLAEGTISLGDLTIDAGRREVRVGERIINLTTVEFDLLWYLAGKAGTVVGRDDIHQTIYNREYSGVERSIDMYISRLRHKLGDDLSVPRLLKTVRGTGYLMCRNAT